jgi:molybdopterin converting factor small subunit
MMHSGSEADLRMVTVRLFAAARDRAGSNSVSVRLPVRATIRELRAALGEASPALRPLMSHLLFAIGTEYVTDDAAVPDAGEIVAFPPVSGG